jgi:hypothetical protein
MLSFPFSQNLEPPPEKRGAFILIRGTLVGRRGMEHVAVSIFVRLLCGLVGEFAGDGQISKQAHGTATRSGALTLYVGKLSLIATATTTAIST